MDYTQGHRIQSQKLIGIYNSTNCFKQEWHHGPHYLPQELHTVRLQSSTSAAGGLMHLAWVRLQSGEFCLPSLMFRTKLHSVNPESEEADVRWAPEHCWPTTAWPQHSFLFRWETGESHFLLHAANCILIKNNFRKQGPTCICCKSMMLPAPQQTEEQLWPGLCPENCSSQALGLFLAWFCVGRVEQELWRCVSRSWAQWPLEVPFNSGQSWFCDSRQRPGNPKPGAIS